jgi:hypothetical protein
MFLVVCDEVHGYTHLFQILDGLAFPFHREAGAHLSLTDVDSVEGPIGSLDELAAGYAEPVEPSHVAVAEDFYFGPVGVVSRSAGAEVEVGGVGEVEPDRSIMGIIVPGDDVWDGRAGGGNPWAVRTV